MFRLWEILLNMKSNNGHWTMVGKGQTQKQLSFSDHLPLPTAHCF